MGGLGAEQTWCNLDEQACWLRARCLRATQVWAGAKQAVLGGGGLARGLRPGRALLRLTRSSL